MGEIGTQQSTAKARSQRSPAYPGIDLKTAIEKVKALYEHEKRNNVPLKVAYERMGYKLGSGAGNVTIAALKRFGLITEEGSGDARRVRITDRAYKILMDNRPESRERQALIREAALLPPIHREMLERYPELPSNASLQYDLVVERGFSEVGAKEFIRVFKATLDFANLKEGDKLSSGERAEDDASGSEDDQMDEFLNNQQQRGRGGAALQDRPETKTIQLPVSLSEWASLQAAFPLTEEKWNQMMDVLKAMKPALVMTQAPPQTAEPPKTEEVEDDEPRQLTLEALEILENERGVPAFVSPSLKRIAEENGVEVTPDMTPNKIIEALKAKA